MLNERYLGVVQADCLDTLSATVSLFTANLGFERFAATMVLDRADGTVAHAWIDNAPPAYQASFCDVASGQRDPVMRHCKQAHTPIVWDQSTYTRVGQGEKWENQAPHGYGAGICLALHLPRGCHFILGVDRCGSHPADASEMVNRAAELQMFAVHAVDSAMRLILPSIHQRNAVELTSRERECLAWTMEGKTAWEVGAILSISEQTAVRHLNNATHKLGAVNKHHAVVKALRLGLIY